MSTAGLAEAESSDVAGAAEPVAEAAPIADAWAADCAAAEVSANVDATTAAEGAGEAAVPALPCPLESLRSEAEPASPEVDRVEAATGAVAGDEAAPVADGRPARVDETVGRPRIRPARLASNADGVGEPAAGTDWVDATAAAVAAPGTTGAELVDV
jgi:hypothetical protein